MPQPGVILAAVGIELRGTLLKSFQGHQHGLERQCLVIEHCIAEGIAKLRRIARTLHSRYYRIGARVGHLERREQRQSRLIMSRLRTTVPRAATGRTLVDAVIPLVVEEMFG